MLLVLLQRWVERRWNKEHLTVHMVTCCCRDSCLEGIRMCFPQENFLALTNVSTVFVKANLPGIQQGKETCQA